MLILRRNLNHPPTMNSSSNAAIDKKSNHLHEAEPRWFAVHTRSRSEKYVCNLLIKKQINSYVPLQRLMKRYKKSTKMLEKPLINSYVFVKIVKGEYLAVLETENVAGFVKFNRNMLAIPETEIDLLRRFILEPGLEIEVVEGTLSVGDPVEIRAGNLMGLRGRVMELKGKRRFLIELEHIGYSLLITIDGIFLDKLGEV